MKLIPVQARISSLQVGQQRNQHGWDQGHKALIPDEMRKFSAQMNLNMFGVIGFERPIVRLVKMDKNRHDLAWTQVSFPFAPLPCCKLGGLPVRSKFEPANHRQNKTTQVDSFLDPSDDE
jgi:hypothetical protein